MKGFLGRQRQIITSEAVTDQLLMQKCIPDANFSIAHQLDHEMYGNVACAHQTRTQCEVDCIQSRKNGGRLKQMSVPTASTTWT